jgi:WD40 repeat protein
MEGVRSIEFSPDGKYIASGGLDLVVNLIDTEKMEILPLLGGDQIEFSPDG